MIALFVALCGGLALADDPSNGALASIWQDGLAMEAQDPHEAATRFRMVYRAEPTFTPALVALGRALQATGDEVEALEVYAQAPAEADVQEERARLLVRLGRDAEAADVFRTLQALRSEASAPYFLGEAKALAKSDPVGALAALRAFPERHGAAWDDDAWAAVSAVAAALPAEERAGFHAVYDAILSAFPAAAVDPRMLELREEIGVRDLAERLAGAAPVPLTPAQLARLDRARAALAGGNATGALADLRMLAVPHNPDVQGALGEALAATGDVAGAESAWRRAMALDPLDPGHPTLLAELLAREYGGRRDAEALELLRLAQHLDPDDAARWERVALLARNQLRPDERAAEIEAWRAYLRLSPDGPDADRARKIVADWEREAPLPPELPMVDRRPADVPKEAWDAVWLAEAWALSGRPARARVEVDRALAVAPKDAHALGLKARLVLAEGGPDARSVALALYQHSLAADPAQPDVLLGVAELLGRGGDAAGARTLREKAADLGSPEAHYLLAVDQWEAGHPFAARERLDAFFAAPSSDRVPEARALEAALRGAFVRWALLGGGALVVLIGGPVAWLASRRSGLAMDAFLARSPHSFRDVARIASIIKHDVLKHHCVVLDAVADALEERDPEPARWVALRLYGPDGAIAKFRSHVAQLEELARIQGLRLNLRHKDPVFGPLIAAMDQLAGLESQLRSGHGRRLAADLRGISAELNGTGPRALSGLVRRLCLLPVERATIEAAFAATATEPAFHGKALPAFSVDATDEAAFVRMFREDLVDVLTNLLRNALQASLEAGSARMSVAVRFEEDDTTGLERVAFRVRDEAPRRVTTAVIRGRYIERGLGLTVDLISKNGGSIRVEDEPGWSKAVVVRFPRVEAE